jgi:hypothetical protein
MHPKFTANRSIRLSIMFIATRSREDDVFRESKLFYRLNQAGVGGD